METLVRTGDRPHDRLGLSDERAVAMFRTMLLARRLDERMWALNRQGRLHFMVSCQGHEGAQVAAGFALRPAHDWVLPYYRDTALALALGTTPRDVLCGAFSRADDPASGGRQMPHHWSDPARRIISGSSVIATQHPHAAGIAWAAARAEDDAIVAVFSGEGATSEGDWHEACNFVGVHRLPCVVVVENNGYAISVPVAEQAAEPVIARRAVAYAMAGITCDGNRPLDVYAAMCRAVSRARAGEGPALLEIRLKRYGAHTSDDDDRYRDAADIAAWRQDDPVRWMRDYLAGCGVLPETAEAEIEEQIQHEVSAAVDAAEAAAPPEDAAAHVYARPINVTEPAGAAVPLPEPVESHNMITAIATTLAELMAADERVVILGEDVGRKGGVFRATAGLFEAFGRERVLDTPIAEALIVGAAIGMAFAGLRPIAEIQFADFLHPAFDQLVSEAARVRYRSNGAWACPIVVRIPYGGGIHGGMYHSQCVEAFYAHVPGLKVVAPATPADAKGLLTAALDDPDPVLFLEPKKLYRLGRGPVPVGRYEVPIGRAAIARSGDDITAVSYGYALHLALAAAEELADDVDVEVVDLRTLKPLDIATVLASVRKTGRLAVLHEDNLVGGLGAEVAAAVAEQAFAALDAPVRRWGMADVPAGPFSPALEEQLMPSVAAFRAVLEELAAY